MKKKLRPGLNGIWEPNIHKRRDEKKYQIQNKKINIIHHHYHHPTKQIEKGKNFI